MSIRNQQIAALYLAVLCQHSINQLNTIDQKYSAYIDKLTPEARSRREQLEADLYPYLNNFESQKRFAQLCEVFAFEKYLEKEFASLFGWGTRTRNRRVSRGARKNSQRTTCDGGRVG